MVRIGIGFLGLLLLNILLRMHYTNGYPIPTFWDSTFCVELSCVINDIEDAQGKNETIVGLVSFDFTKDGYLAYYLGWLMKLLSKLSRPPRFLILQASDEFPLWTSALAFLKLLPPGLSLCLAKSMLVV